MPAACTPFCVCVCFDFLFIWLTKHSKPAILRDEGEWLLFLVQSCSFLTLVFDGPESFICHSLPLIVTPDQWTTWLSSVVTFGLWLLKFVHQLLLISEQPWLPSAVHSSPFDGTKLFIHYLYLWVQSCSLITCIYGCKVVRSSLVFMGAKLFTHHSGVYREASSTTAAWMGVAKCQRCVGARCTWSAGWICLTMSSSSPPMPQGSWVGWTLTCLWGQFCC